MHGGKGEHTTEAHATIKRKKISDRYDMNLKNKMLDIETPRSTIPIHLFPEKTFLICIWPKWLFRRVVGGSGINYS